MVQDNEYRVLSEQLKGLTTLINAQFQEVHERLDKINGKVALHDVQITEALIERARNREEQKNIIPTHILSCPLNGKLSALEDSVSELEGCGNKIKTIEKSLEDVNFFLRHPKLFIGMLVVLVLISLATFLENSPLRIFTDRVDSGTKIEATK